jgi:hypothetical protein
MNEGGVLLVYISNFLPLNVDSIRPGGISSKNSFQSNFGLENKQLEYYFSLFIFSNESLFIEGIKKMKYTCLGYKKIISNLI